LAVYFDMALLVRCK